MAIYKLGVIHPRLEFVGAENLTTYWFLRHNFGSRYARKPTKGSKDSCGSLVTTQTWAKKLAHWIGAYGRVKQAIKTLKHPHLWCLPGVFPDRKKKLCRN